jgi:hypothetical protein
MKKFLFAFAMIATLVAALVSSTNVFAQGGTPPAAPQTPTPAYPQGVGPGANTSVMGGILHDEMIAAYAEKLGISVDDLNDRLANGETMAQIAASAGLTADQFTTLMQEARSQAIDAAVEAGTLTQAQADWMKTRGPGMMGANSGMGRGAGRGRGMHGMGMGMGNPSNCPFFSQTNQ